MSNEPPPDSLKNKIAVQSADSRVNGQAIAIQFARAGADVLVHANTNRSAAQSTCEAIEKLGQRCKWITADFTEIAQQDRFCAEAWDWQGRIDVWMNNAGGDVLTNERRQWTFEQKLDFLWRIDVQAAMRISRNIGQRMRNQSGNDIPSILHIGWDQAEWGMEGDSGELFSTVKAAVMAFSKSLSRSLAPSVRVNCIAPGWIKTSWGEQAETRWSIRAQKESLMHRWGTPSDVAAAAVFLASPAASFISGHVLPVNGGFRMDSAFDAMS
jgi:3-oxoacyl-[acyl-carrier protein] reductase